jgi:hypothetical protein
MADWVTISSLATAGGTLALAVATYSSVRSSNRAARIAERSLQIGLRPVLAASRLDDPHQKVDFADRRGVKVPGGTAVIDDAGEVIYLSMSVRNVGAGLAVLRGWCLWPDIDAAGAEHPPVEDFRTTHRDIYVAAGDIGFWQGAIRDPDDPIREPLRASLRERNSMYLDVLYGDHEDGQPTITRFGLLPRDADDGWTPNVSRHWLLEREL